MASLYDWRKLIGKPFIDTMYAEAGGAKRPEQEAVAGAFFRQLQNGRPLDKVMNSSSAFKFKSPAYVKARDENFTPYERKFYNNMRNNVYDSMYRSNGGYAEPPPWANFENVKKYGEPSWATDTYQDIGRQRFYSNVN